MRQLASRDLRVDGDGDGAVFVVKSREELDEVLQITDMASQQERSLFSALFSPPLTRSSYSLIPQLKKKKKDP